MQEPICAIATPPGRSAIGVIRCSGEKIFPIIEKFFSTPRGKVILKEKPRYALYGNFTDGKELIDEVILIPFVSPNSYTGEDMVEIHAHGNPIILQKILKVLLSHGFRPALPGEFTKRAYLNRKIDLTQAEAIKAIIEAKAERELQQALNLRQGSFRKEILSFRSELLNLIADINAELDFIDEGLTFSAKETKLRQLEELLEKTNSLILLAERTQRYRHGFEVAIIGAPNAGKSSLLNRICGEERAIVSDIPGTTRDYLESEITLDGISFTFLDTAGIRAHVQDLIEKQGIERSLKKAQVADIIIFLIDGSIEKEKALPEEILSVLSQTPEKIIFSVINKKDILHESMKELAFLPGEVLYLSLKTGEGFVELLEKLKEKAQEKMPHGDALLLAPWQIELLKKLKEHLIKSKNFIELDEYPEIISAELNLALDALAEITGEIQSEEILGRIFSRFCIGK